MYRDCIYCAADLGANESVEHFPVGRSVAFGGEKGRATQSKGLRGGSSG